MIKRKRHILKALTFRISATLITFVISYLLTGNLKLSGSIMIIEFITKFIWYYIHERIWYKSNFGLDKKE